MKKTAKPFLIIIASALSLLLFALGTILLINLLTPWRADKNRFQDDGKTEDVFRFGVNTLSDRYTPLFELSLGDHYADADPEKTSSQLTLFSGTERFTYKNTYYSEKLHRRSDRYEKSENLYCVVDAETGLPLVYRTKGPSAYTYPSGSRALSPEELTLAAEQFVASLLGKEAFSGYEAVSYENKDGGPTVTFAKSYFGYLSGDTLRVGLTTRGDVWFYLGSYINDNAEHEERLTKAMLDKAAKKLNKKLDSLNLESCEPGTSSIVRDLKGDYYLSLNFTYVGSDGESYYDCLYYRLFRA